MLRRVVAFAGSGLQMKAPALVPEPPIDADKAAGESVTVGEGGAQAAGLTA